MPIRFQFLFIVIQLHKPNLYYINSYQNLLALPFNWYKNLQYKSQYEISIFLNNNNNTIENINA